MDELATIRSAVSRYFTVSGEVKVQDGVYEFRVLVGPNLEGDFKKLVADLKSIGYVPVIVKGKDLGSDYLISVIKKRKTHPFGIWVNIVLLVATIASTTYVGEILYAGYFGSKFSWFLYVDGFLYFSLPLLIILASHEFGHYFVARRNAVAASLPFFIPVPVPPLGTMGAFISLRDPLPDRKTLIKIGAAGPIVGFVMSIVVGVVGAWLGTVQKPVVVTSSQVTTLISLPLIYNLIPFLQIHSVHPVAFAAWVGFLVTAINLFPIGQLDGGHIARGLLGKNAKYLSYAFVIILILFGIYYFSWILFAVIVIILGLTHPPPLNDISRPGKKEIMVGIVAVALVAISFSPVPIAEHFSPNIATVSLTEGNYYSVFGSPALTNDTLVLTIDNLNNYTIPLGVTIYAPIGISATPPFNETLSPMEKASYNISVWPTNSSSLGLYQFSVTVDASTLKKAFERQVMVVALDPNITANYMNPFWTDKPVANLTLVNNGALAQLDIHKFNNSSVFFLNGTMNIGTSGSGTYVTIPPNGKAEISVTFSNLTDSSGIVLLNVNNPWHALLIFYIPPGSSEYKLLT